jgi:hypothetical protein
MTRRNSALKKSSRASDAVAVVTSSHPLLRIVLVLAAAVWGMVVDGNFIQILTPTGNSTLFQASTAAAFAILGILFGPLAGAMGGLIRDGSSFVVNLIEDPGLISHPDFWQVVGRSIADTLEDVVLGLVPGIVALYTRRLSILSLVAGVTAWFSLPFLVISNTLIAGYPDKVWLALGTATGNWDQPVDPSIYVYGLFTAALVALGLSAFTRRPVVSLAFACIFLLAGLAVMPVGARG